MGWGAKAKPRELGCIFKESAVVRVEEERPLSEADRAAGVVRHAWARLGARADKRSLRLREVEIKTADQHLLLVTNLSIEQAEFNLYAEHN